MFLLLLSRELALSCATLLIGGYPLDRISAVRNWVEVRLHVLALNHGSLSPAAICASDVPGQMSLLDAASHLFLWNPVMT